MYRTFDRRIIFVDEVALDQLDRQTRLSDTTTANNNELILAQKLQQENVLASSAICMCIRRASAAARIDRPVRRIIDFSSYLGCHCVGSRDDSWGL